MADNDRQNPSQRRSLIALGVVVFLFMVGWILAHELYANENNGGLRAFRPDQLRADRSPEPLIGRGFKPL